MKVRHAAALALAGWYLMFPPFRSDGKSLDLLAPLSAWRIAFTFDSAKECEDIRSRVYYGADIPQRYRVFDNVGGIGYMQCIGTDDPRLKPD
jgi:hypothetical protein